MTYRRCSHCGRFLGRYLIAHALGLACVSCGPHVDGGWTQRGGQRMLFQLQRIFQRYPKQEHTP